jgi:hypothetical protein
VQRHEEIVGGHQLAHDAVHGGEQRLEPVGGVRRLGDAIHRLLHRFAAAPPGDVVPHADQADEPPFRIADLRRRERDGKLGAVLAAVPQLPAPAAVARRLPDLGLQAGRVARRVDQVGRVPQHL